MVKFGIISDTHIKKNYNPAKVKALLKQLQLAFRDVDEIIHAGDVCDEFFLEQLNEIAPIKCVKGNPVGLRQFSFWQLECSWAQPVRPRP